MSEQPPAKPVVPALDLESQDSGSGIARKKTFSERVKGAGKTIKKIVTPRSRTSSMSEAEEAAVAKKETAVEATESAGEKKVEKESYVEVAKKAAKKALGMEDKKVVEEEDKAPSRLANSGEEEKKKSKDNRGLVGGLVAVAVLAVGLILSKASQKKPEPVVEKKKSFLNK